MTNNDIHICKFKKGKLIDATTDRMGNFYCKACGAMVPPTQVIDYLVEEERAKQERKNKARRNR